jgi:high-affinity iron transporter
VILRFHILDTRRERAYPTFPPVLRHLSRGTTLVGVLVASLLVGLVGFTALGLGGGDGPQAKAPPRSKVKPTVYVQHETAAGNVGRSESIGLRENGGAGDPDTPALGDKVPFKPEQFDGPIRAYRRYAAGQVRHLRTEVATLARAIDDGERGTARTAWKAAFARYLRLGAVYGAFGQLDTDIDGLPGGLPKGERDHGFIGLHRIELGLWTGQPVRSLAPAAARLKRDVGKLGRKVYTSAMEPLDYATRAHEILEDAQRDFMSGTSVKWSDEGVLATDSGVEATALILRTLHPLLKGQQAQVTTEAGIARIRKALAAVRRAHGGTDPPLGELSRRERQQINGTLSWTLERLQDIPGSLETFDPPAIPKLASK